MIGEGRVLVDRNGRVEAGIRRSAVEGCIVASEACGEAQGEGEKRAWTEFIISVQPGDKCPLAASVRRSALSVENRAGD
jgi:hypothetical protein